MRKQTLAVALIFLLSGCLSSGKMVRPEKVEAQLSNAPIIDGLNSERPQPSQVAQVRPAYNNDAKARYHFVKDYPQGKQRGVAGVVSNMNPPEAQFHDGGEPMYQVERNTNPHVRPYQGPLNVGDPGASASLWRTSGAGSTLFRDHRAYQPMDLITIIVREDSKGTNEADTETTKESSLLMGVANLFNFELDAEAKNPGLDTATLVDADVQNEFTGEGETTREGTLEARIAAVVVEVLPNGVIRIEGEKIIAVNNEEQIMVISGLVRPKDVTSNNEVMSTKVANLRIDYFGKGIVGEQQYAGWLGRVLGVLWPF